MADIRISDLLVRCMQTAAPLALVVLSFEILRLFGVMVINPGLPLLAAIVYTGFAVGMQAALIAAGASVVYEVLALLGLPHFFQAGAFSLYASAAAMISGALHRHVETRASAEADRRAALKWQAESATLQDVLSKLPLGVLMADAASGEITFANQKARSILGDDLQRLHSIGFPSMNHIADGRSYSPDEWPWRRCVEECAAIEEEFLYVRDNGQIVIIHAHSTPICNPDGQVIAAIMSLIEVAEKKHLERRLALVALDAAAPVSARMVPAASGG